MKNVQLPLGNNAFSLPQLRARKKELVDAINHIDSVIESLEMLEKTGVLTSPQPRQVAPTYSGIREHNVYKDMSMYEAAASILSKANQSLSMDEIVEAMKKGGKEIKGRDVVAPTLYKAVRTKKDCKIAVENGKWRLA